VITQGKSFVNHQKSKQGVFGGRTAGEMVYYGGSWEKKKKFLRRFWGTGKNGF
jgi:hypothetical protein